MRTAGPTDRAASGLAGAPDEVWAGRRRKSCCALALSQPREAMAIANRLIAGGNRPGVAVRWRIKPSASCYATSGHCPEAISHLRVALRTAKSLRDRPREGDVHATLGAALVSCGRTRAGLRAAGLRVGRSARGLDRARVQLRRAHVLLQLGRSTEALDDLTFGARGRPRAGDRLWQARCLVHRGWARSSRGLYPRRRQMPTRPNDCSPKRASTTKRPGPTNNRADYAYYRGDLPRALALLDAAELRFAELATCRRTRAETRCRVLLTAGLAPEALRGSRGGSRATPTLPR